LAAAVEPWVYILHHMGYNIEYCTQFLYRITCVFDICPISGASDWASKTSTTEHFASVRDRVLDYSKHMFHHLLNLIPRGKIQCIAAGVHALEASTYILEGTGVTLVNGDVLPHPCKGKNGWMTVDERHTYVAHSCKLMSGLVGQEFSIDKLSYNQLDLVYGVCGSLELQWWKEHDNVTAGSEVGYVADWIKDKEEQKINERAREEEEARVRKEECARTKAREMEEARVRKEECARTKAREIYDKIAREEERAREVKECKNVDNVDKRNSKRKRCSHEGCTNQAQKRGVCIRHGAERKLCSHEGCTNQAQKLGVCCGHGAERKLCSHEGCTNTAKKLGVCTRHGAVSKCCSHEGCTNVARKLGVCCVHGAVLKRCSHEGCTNQAQKRGVCIRHGAGELEMITGRILASS
jgi:hypothetical protein